jgi:hypothetical protein
MFAGACSPIALEDNDRPLLRGCDQAEWGEEGRMDAIVTTGVR